MASGYSWHSPNNLSVKHRSEACATHHTTWPHARKNMCVFNKNSFHGNNARVANAAGGDNLYQSGTQCHHKGKDTTYKRRATTTEQNKTKNKKQKQKQKPTKRTSRCIWRKLLRRILFNALCCCTSLKSSASRRTLTCPPPDTSPSICTTTQNHQSATGCNDTTFGFLHTL